MALRRATAVAVEVTVTTRPGDLERVVHAVDELGAVHGLPRDLVADVNVALDEVLDNIVRYAYRDEGRYEIRVRIVPSANHLDVEVEDDGIPFDPTTAPVTPVNGGSVRDRAAGGLGLRFVRHLMDEVTYERVGTRNRLRLRKRLRPATRPTIF